MDITFFLLKKLVRKISHLTVHFSLHLLILNLARKIFIKKYLLFECQCSKSIFGGCQTKLCQETKAILLLPCSKTVIDC